MPILLIAEHDNIRLLDATGKTLSAALSIGSDIHVLVAGMGAKSAAMEAADLKGVAKVLHSDAGILEHQLAEPIADLIVSLADGYETIIAPATASGKNYMPRVAALLDVMQISDIVAVDAPDIFQRTIYAGNAIQTVKPRDMKQVITVRTSAFPAAESGGDATVESVQAPTESGLSSFVGADITKSDRPELPSAKIVVSGGRGMGSSEAFAERLAPIADRLGAAIGASRAAVDSGYMPNDHQVGQTGKVVAPELYIAVGISGAIQHLAGMKDSKIIVAINKDDEAPIFEVADYGLVADLFQALPDLDEELKRAGY